MARFLGGGAAYVRCDGPKYTRRGENRSILQQKAVAFKRNWASYKDAIDEDEAVDWAPVRPEGLDVGDTAWSFVSGVFRTKDKLKWARVLGVDHGLDLLKCTEDDVRGVLESYIFEGHGGQ